MNFKKINDTSEEEIQQKLKCLQWIHVGKTDELFLLLRLCGIAWVLFFPGRIFNLPFDSRNFQIVVSSLYVVLCYPEQRNIAPIEYDIADKLHICIQIYYYRQHASRYSHKTLPY